MYQFFLGKMLLPVAPSEMTIDTGNNNKTYTMLDDGQINILKGAPLKDISFDFLLPTDNAPYATYSLGVVPSVLIIEYLKKLKDDKEPFQFIVIRLKPNGVPLEYTNLKVSLEEYSINESVQLGFDYKISIRLKEYKTPPSLLGTIMSNAGKVTTAITAVTEAVSLLTSDRDTTSSPEPKNNTVIIHIVKDGETLWEIAKKYFDDGSKYNLIAKENNINDPNRLNVGQKLRIVKQ